MKKAFLIAVMVALLLFAAVAAATLLSMQRGERVQAEFEDGEIDNVNTADLDGVSVAYRAYGEDYGDTIVLVHGFLGSSYDYRYLSERLSETHRVIAVDLPGFGHSDKPLDYDYTRENQAETLASLMEALGIERYVLGGHSMGGDVVLRHADMYPERVEKLVLFASVGGEESAPRALPRIVYALLFQNYYVQRRGFDTLFVDENFQSAAYFEPMYYFTRQIPTAVLRKFSEDRDETPLTELLGEIETPTLLLYGDKDTWTPLEIGETLDDSLANSSLEILENVGHMPFMETPEETFALMESFVEDD